MIKTATLLPPNMETEFTCSQMKDVGPNVRNYYYRKAISGTIMDLIGFIPSPFTLSLSLSFGLSEITNELVLFYTNGRYGIQYNPDTGDFKSIEATLRYYDNLGIELH